MEVRSPISEMFAMTDMIIVTRLCKQSCIRLILEAIQKTTVVDMQYGVRIGNATHN